MVAEPERAAKIRCHRRLEKWGKRWILRMHSSEIHLVMYVNSGLMVISNHRISSVYMSGFYVYSNEYESLLHACLKVVSCRNHFSNKDSPDFCNNSKIVFKPGQLSLGHHFILKIADGMSSISWCVISKRSCNPALPYGITPDGHRKSISKTVRLP